MRRPFHAGAASLVPQQCRHHHTVEGSGLTEERETPMFHMNADTATSRELRTDFRSVKRRIEQHGEVVVTDHNEPAYVIKSLPAPAKKRSTLGLARRQNYGTGSLPVAAVRFWAIGRIARRKSATE